MDGEKGEGSMEVGEEGEYLSLHCHHQNDFCIKVGSDESHFNVLLIVRDKVTRQCPRTTISEEKGEPKRTRTRSLRAYQPNALPLGQAGSLLLAFNHGQRERERLCVCVCVHAYIST